MKTRTITVVLIAAAVGAEAFGDGSYLLLDDFSASRLAVGIEWEGFTDRVMGGRSEMSSGIVIEEGEPLLEVREIGLY